MISEFGLIHLELLVASIFVNRDVWIQYSKANSNFVPFDTQTNWIDKRWYANIFFLLRKSLNLILLLLKLVTPLTQINFSIQLRPNLILWRGYLWFFSVEEKLSSYLCQRLKWVFTRNKYDYRVAQLVWDKGKKI